MDSPTLSQLALLVHPMMDSWGADSNVVEKYMETHKEEAPEIRIRNAMAALELEVLEKAPMWARVNILSHKMATAQQ